MGRNTIILKELSRRTPIALIRSMIDECKRLNVLPYKVWLSREVEAEMCYATALTIEDREILIGYRSLTDRYTISCETIPEEE
jgi:hypothetical protein